MDDIQISYFRNLTASKRTGVLNLEEYVQKLQQPDPAVRTMVEELRRKEKGNPEYDALKRKLPCFLLNARTSGGCKGQDIIDLHPFLFLDVDGVPEDSIELVKSCLVQMLPSIMVIWRSAGGRGLGILLRVEGRTMANLPDLKSYLCSLEFQGYKFDSACFNINRKTIHSFDPEMYLNWDAPALDWSLVPKEEEVVKGAVHSITPRKGRGREREGNGVNSTFFGRLRFDNFDEAFPEGDAPYVLFPTKVSFVQVERRWSKVYANRNQWLFTNLVRLRWLNPTMPLPLLFSIARSMNRRSLASSLEESEVRKVVTNVFQGQYIPVPNIERRVLFNPSTSLSGREKQALTSKLIGTKRTDETKQKIYDAIEGYSGDEKITAKLVSTISGVQLDNVKRKWPEFKEYVKGINEARRGLTDKGENAPACSSKPTGTIGRISSDHVGKAAQGVSRLPEALQWVPPQAVSTSNDGPGAPPWIS